MRGGLEESLRLGYAIVIVLGLPDYYPLFGFSSKAAKALECPYYDAGDAWMAHELIPRALDAVRGWVVYPPAFDGALLKGDLLRTPSIEFTISTIIHAKLVRDDQKT